MEFREKSLRLFHVHGIPPRYIPPELRRIVRRKLTILDNAISLNDLRIPPANRLERLKGNLANYHSIRVNNQYRIIFT
ncbi:type II toxin-antitoxin system RelE/ParE family toxin [Corynebacterium oculi]|uniref:type II toxin-antitoxin system RelE/ParE family toxin n=1 Tax=Corynebacterium oculi TaxID=1544416 RepID=UPI00123792B4|nr:type II toxin-antitoxin system RelE/ParE family toxin [Corynebacterium oculi]